MFGTGSSVKWNRFIYLFIYFGCFYIQWIYRIWIFWNAIKIEI